MSIIEQLEKRKRLLSYLNSPSNEEVYTPVALVEEMLDKLPVEVWKNPDLRWVDPCAKSGIFMLEVIIRLMKNLEIGDETFTYNHIINNMVKAYVNVERNKWLVSKMIYGNTDKVRRVELLEIDKVKTENMPKFDVVVGNPPFQAPGARVGWAQLYISFIDKGLEILKPNGLLLFVSPPTFLKNKINVIKNYQIKYLNFSIVKKYFLEIGSSFCYYLIQKKEKNEFTIIEGNDNKIFKANINYNNFFPVSNVVNEQAFSIVEKIYSKKGRTFKFKRNQIPIPINAIFVRRQNRNPYFNALKTFKDFDKKIKISQDYTMDIDVENGISLLNSKLYKFLYKCYSTSPFITLDFINKIPFPNINFKDMTDKQIYEYFNITTEEINYIETQIK